MSKVSLRRGFVCAALGLIALVTSGCSQSQQSVQSELVISADALRATVIGREDQPPPYTLLLIRLEAYRVELQSEGLDSPPFPTDFGDPDKVPVATTEILGSVFMKQIEACDSGQSTCRVVLPFLVPGGGSLEIRAYAFFNNNFLNEDSEAPFVLTTELMFGSTLYRGVREEEDIPPLVGGKLLDPGCLANPSSTADVGIRLSWWDDFMCQLPPGYSNQGNPTNNFRESDNGPGYADVTGDITLNSGTDAQGNDCPVDPQPQPGFATTVIAWDSVFGVPYVGTNNVYETIYTSCSGPGCYSLNFNNTFPGAPGTRRVDVFGVLTGFGIQPFYPYIDAQGYAIVNGRRVDSDDSYDVDGHTTHYDIPFIGQQGLTQGVYVNTTGSGVPNDGVDLNLNGCARSARVAMNFTEEVFSPLNPAAPIMIPLTLPALRQASEEQQNNFGNWPTSLGNRAVSYLTDSGGYLMSTADGGLALMGQSRNIIYVNNSGGEVIVGGAKGLGPDVLPSLPTAWNVFPVPTFGIPYPGGPKWQESHLFVSNLYDPRDPCEAMNFDFTPCYFSYPVTTEYWDDGNEGDPPSSVCDPEKSDDGCYPMPAVAFDDVPLNPNAAVNPVNARVRRLNPPRGCAITPEQSMLIDHPYNYGSDGSFLVAGRLQGTAGAINAGVDNLCESSAYWGNNYDELGVARAWRQDHWKCDPFYFVGSGGAFPEAGDTFQLSTVTSWSSEIGPNWASIPVNLTCTDIYEGVLVGGSGHFGNFSLYNLFHIDPYQTGSGGSLRMYGINSGLSTPLSGLAIDPDDFAGVIAGVVGGPSDCTVYATEFYASNSAGMFLINAATGSVDSTIYPVGGNLNLLSGDISDITFDPVSDEVLAMLGGGLYGIDPVSGDATLRGPASSNGGVLAITPDGSTLYTVLADDLKEDAAGNLAIINRTTNALISMIPLDDSAVGSCRTNAMAPYVDVPCDILSMTISTDGRIFALVYYYDDEFVSEYTYLVIIDPATGEMEILGDVNQEEFSGPTYMNVIAWAPKECGLDRYVPF